MNITELSDKIEILETRQAFQEDTVESLNTVIINQQKDIEMLQLKIDALQLVVKNSADSHNIHQGEEPPPPHY